MLERPDRPPPPDRHARHRSRVKAGKACYQVELGCEELSWLIRLHWLAESEASDRCAVGSAVSRMISDAARR